MIEISEKNPHNYAVVFHKAAIFGALQELDLTTMEHHIAEFNKAEARAKLWEMLNGISEKAEK